MEVNSANKALTISRDGGTGYPGTQATCEGSSDVRKPRAVEYSSSPLAFTFFEHIGCRRRRNATKVAGRTECRSAPSSPCDASGLKEPEKVRACKKQVLEALQAYTISHYPSQPSKFGELLLCVPELERACQVSKESLAASRRIASSGGASSSSAPMADPQAPSFNLLFELLRGDH
ncbi:hypothetical protein HPB52_013420 [Rhipicephalus sanguineus]|uniref:NR LBD domain-containing protein n=1 Tax=Rhipicephalus sanguineus TaxID=34632 RepID=A0A9D4TA44_RHISA|nr:hypothetical protein HPB52_013420 [Rhipicephalus sanguineus]